MLRKIGFLFIAGAFLLLLFQSTTVAGGKEEMVENPRYKFWANFKKGSKAVHVEEVKFSSDDQDLVPGGVAQKEITYTLLKVTPEFVSVKTVVKERDFLSYIQSAPTTIFYPAKVKKSHLQTLINETGAKVTDVKVTHKGKEYPCKLLTGKMKSGGQEIEFKKWVSEEVPGGIFRQERIARQDGTVVYEATIEVKKITVKK